GDFAVPEMPAQPGSTRGRRAPRLRTAPADPIGPCANRARYRLCELHPNRRARFAAERAATERPGIVRRRERWIGGTALPPRPDSRPEALSPAHTGLPETAG